MMGGVRTARGVPPSAKGSDQRSSVGHSRGVDRAIDSPLVVTAVGAAVAATLWRRVTRCGASMQGRAAMMGGVRTVRGVPPSSMASDQRSSVGHSRGVDRAIDSPLVVTAVGAAVAATLWRRVTGCAALMEGRAALAGGVRTAYGVLLSTMGFCSSGALQ